MGTNIWKQTTDYTAEDFSFLTSTNLESAYNMSQLAHPLLKASGAGSIVFISSVSSVSSLPIGSISSISKGNQFFISNYFFIYVTQDNIGHDWNFDEEISFRFSAAMNQLTKVLACEWAKDNIRCNSVAPWFTRTPLAEPVTFFPFANVISYLLV